MKLVPVRKVRFSYHANMDQTSSFQRARKSAGVREHQPYHDESADCNVGVSGFRLYLDLVSLAIIAVPHDVGCPTEVFRRESWETVTVQWRPDAEIDFHQSKDEDGPHGPPTPRSRRSHSSHRKGP